MPSRIRKRLKSSRIAAASESCSSACFEAPGATKDFGVAAKLLVQKRDGPAAHHPVALRGIDGLKRIVPVAVAIADQMRAGDEALAHRCDQLVDVGCDRIGMGRLLKIVLAPPGDRFVEKGEIAGRFDIVAESFQRPDDDVAMRLPVLHGRIGLEHEPLRPVASLLVLLGENDAQNRLGRLVVLQRQQQLHRTLADIAGAPCGARILLEAMRHGEMHHGVVRQPREDRVDRLGVASASALLMRMPRVMLRQKRTERASIVASSTWPAYLAASASARFGSVIEPTTAKTNSFVGHVRIAAKAPLRRLPSA